MLRLTLTLCTPQPHPLGYLDIQNDGMGSEALGHYHVMLRDAEQVLQRATHLADFPRHLGAWVLVRQALEALDALPLPCPIDPCPSTDAVLAQAETIEREEDARRVQRGLTEEDTRDDGEGESRCTGRRRQRRPS